MLICTVSVNNFKTNTELFDNWFLFLDKYVKTLVKLKRNKGMEFENT